MHEASNALLLTFLTVLAYINALLLALQRYQSALNA